jgi:peptide/nickel transport system substrate-binding protein
MSEWDDLQAVLRTSGMSRREFLGRATVLGISTALASSVLSRIGVAAETPKRGGHLIIGLDGASSGNTLDPALLTATYMQGVGMQLYDTLTDVDEQLKVQPALAESWTTKAGAREWVLKLRKGVTFHNGKELTAADVVYSINHHRGKDSKSPAKALIASVTDLKATAKDEITLTLDSGNADMPALLADQRLGIVPEGSNFADGVGTGTFILEYFQPGVRTRVKRNPNYWRSDRGFVDSVETVAINDPTARMSALQSGSIHLMNRADPKIVTQLERNPQIQIFNVAGASHYTFPMRCDTAPFDNLDMRLALKYAVDRETMVRTVLRGYGKLGNDQPIPGFDPFFAADIPQRPYDPDKAKFHFKKSGYGGPIVLSVADIAFTGAIEAAQLYQAGAAKAGITLQVDRVPSDGYWDNVWMKKPFTGSYWSGQPTADLMFTYAYKSDAAWNETFWKRPKFDQLLMTARAELDTAKRKQMYREMQLMVYEDGGEIIPMFNNFLDAALKKVRGFVPHPLGQMSRDRAPERIWLDE